MTDGRLKRICWKCNIGVSAGVLNEMDLGGQEAATSLRNATIPDTLGGRDLRLGGS
jgi:hypothetical protein